MKTKFLVLGLTLLAAQTGWTCSMHKAQSGGGTMTFGAAGTGRVAMMGATSAAPVKLKYSGYQENVFSDGFFSGQPAAAASEPTRKRRQAAEDEEISRVGR